MQKSKLCSLPVDRVVACDSQPKAVTTLLSTPRCADKLHAGIMYFDKCCNFFQTMLGGVGIMAQLDNLGVSCAKHNWKG